MTQIKAQQPSASAGGCSVCSRSVPTPYKTPDGGSECSACYRRRRRVERGLKPPGPKADPSKPRSRHGAARANEGTQAGRVGRPTQDTCPNGHRYTPENTFTYADERYRGGVRRGCKICRRNSQLRHQGKEHLVSDKPVGIWNRHKTHCPAGHPYEQFGRTRADGSRFCTICHRQKRIEATYGLTVEQWDALVLAQQGRCAICLQELTDPHVDHDHETDAVRALLCNNCNNGLGRFLDDPALLRTAAAYVESHR